jgi:sulfite reductase (NADPH) hemoprotein beta-component
MTTMTHIATQAGPVGHAAIYRYDDFDRRFVQERVAQFRDQANRRLAGELTEDEFKPLRLMNGLYLQLHAYMLRVAIPYGVLSSQQVRALAEIGRKYDKGYAHVTTRQNLQYNWIKLEEAADALQALADVDMHAIQTSGNCVRNVTTDQFAGVATDEAEDPRVYAEIMRQWSSLHPEFSFLPRKFKIAITGSHNDRAAIKFHDVGLRVRRNPDGSGGLGAEVWVGGGQGRAPFIAKLARDFLPEEDLLAYLEAILRVYNAYGRRDNMQKARIKILVHELGIVKFLERVEAEFARLKGPRYRLDEQVVADIRRHFAPVPYDADGGATPVAPTAEEAEAFARWLAANVVDTRAAGYVAVTVSLKPPGGIPGDITSNQMDAVADLADRLSFGEIRATHMQNLVLPYVRRADLLDLWRTLDKLELAAPNIGLVGDIIACPGLDYCSLANARSIPLAQDISARFADPARQAEVGELNIKISGCINACGHHHVGHIGILGVDKKGAETYQITLGGRADMDAAIGDIAGPAVDAEQVPALIEKIIGIYLAARADGERFIDTLARLGVKYFKEALRAAD